MKMSPNHPQALMCTSKEPRKDNARNWDPSSPLEVVKLVRIKFSFCKLRKLTPPRLSFKKVLLYKLEIKGPQNLNYSYKKCKTRYLWKQHWNLALITQCFPIILTKGLAGSAYFFIFSKHCHTSCCALGCLENSIWASHFLLALSQKTVRIWPCHKSLRPYKAALQFLQKEEL